MADRHYPANYNDRPQRTKERGEQWREEHNDRYGARGWEPDYERDSSLGEYYPTGRYYEGGTDFIDQNYVTGGRMPRSLSDNQETGYNERYSRGQSQQSGRERQRAEGDYGNAYREQSRHRDFYGQYGGQGYGDSDTRMGSQERPGQRGGQDRWSGQGYGEDEYQRTSFRGKGPKGYVRSDERIKEEICERLSDDPSIDASDVSVDVQEGVVRLEGSVDQRFVKHRIEDLVDRCSGVKDIENKLTISAKS